MDQSFRIEPEVTGSQSVDRAFALLLLVARMHRSGAGLRELVVASGLKQPTVRRLLVALMRAGMVEQEAATRRYFLGPESYVVGTLAADRFGIHRLALDSLSRLARQSEDTAFISLRRDTYSVCLHREEGAFPIRTLVLAAGDRHPLGVGAGSLSMLAALPDPEVAMVLEQNAPVLAARYPTLTPKLLIERIAETRSQGYAVNRGIVLAGSWGVGVAVRDAAGEAVAALSIAAIESRLGEARQRELAKLLQDEVGQLEARLRDPKGLREQHASASAATGQSPRKGSETRR